MTQKKYELLTEDTKLNGKLKRIRALRDILRYGVKSGDLGGYVESEANLSHEGDCWISGNACVSGNAKISGDAWVYENGDMFGDVAVSGNAQVSENAIIKYNHNYIVIQNCGKFSRSITITCESHTLKIGVAGCFHGGVKQFKEAVIKKYGDEYGSYSKAIKMIDSLDVKDFI